MFVVRNNRNLETLQDHLKNKRLPFKVFTQEMRVTRSLNENAYLWGVVYEYISDFTGETKKRIHDFYKWRFNVVYEPDKHNAFRLRIKGTSEMSTLSFEEFALMVRADAALEFKLRIPFPNEVIVPEQVNELNLNEMG